MSDMGFVYLIARSDGLVKIGYSADPLARLSSLQVAHTEPLRLLAMIPRANPRKTEGELHETFADCNIGGEWFRLSELDLGHALTVATKTERWFDRMFDTHCRVFTREDVTKIVTERINRYLAKQKRNTSGAQAES